MDKYDLSLILPCFNEAEIFIDSINRIIRVLDETHYTWEIIFVDDKSKDKTPQLIKRFLKKNPRNHFKAYFHQVNQGRGQTVKDGFLKAEGKIVGFIDIDLEIGEWYLPKFIGEVERGADAAIALRIYDFNLKALHRWFASKGYMWLRKLILDLPYEDTEAGYKFFKREKIRPLLEKCQFKGWFWDTEIMSLSHRHKLKVVQIPVAFKRRFDKTSTVNFLPDTIAYFKDLLSFKFKNKC